MIRRERVALLEPIESIQTSAGRGALRVEYSCDVSDGFLSQVVGWNLTTDLPTDLKNPLTCLSLATILPPGFCLHYSPKHDCITFRIGGRLSRKLKMNKISVGWRRPLHRLVVLVKSHSTF